MSLMNRSRPIKPGYCYNGCNAPISPPSKVICRGCQDDITRKLEAWAAAHPEQESPDATD